LATTNTTTTTTITTLLILTAGWQRLWCATTTTITTTTAAAAAGGGSGHTLHPISHLMVTAPSAAITHWRCCVRGAAVTTPPGSVAG
jgi:hypothetical protein